MRSVVLAMALVAAGVSPLSASAQTRATASSYFPFIGCGGSPSNSFEIIRDQQKQSYDSMRITLKEEDSQLS